jgi:hypothetical protein
MHLLIWHAVTELKTVKMLEKLWSEIVRGLANGHMSTNGRLDFREVCELVD